MARTMDDLKMVHEEEMKNYDRIESLCGVRHAAAWV